MALNTLIWKLASPYDAYISHVIQLKNAIERIRYFSDLALGYEAGLHGSVRIVPVTQEPGARIQRFRERLGIAAEQMSDEEFEAFIADLGGGAAADVETDRAKTVSRMTHHARGLEEYFAVAARELAILEQRGYNPARMDVARQLRENHLPPTTVSEYRHLIHTLGLKVGKKAE
ncbi:MAG TPA: hypothetical protein VIK11_06650 [Tepidiformaceae bacterium]